MTFFSLLITVIDDFNSYQSFPMVVDVKLNKHDLLP